MATYSRAIINNSIIVSAVNSADIIDKAIQLHCLSPVSADCLGRVLTVVALMGKQLKNSDDYLTAIISGGGPIGTITACADNNTVKGYVTNTVVDNMYDSNGRLDIASAVGKEGRLTVIKDIGLKQPYIGTSQLVSGTIAEDFANYFATSQQQPCALTVGLSLTKDGHCKSGGGVLVEVMPNCDEQLLSDVETVMYAMDEMSYQFDNSTARQVIERFFNRFEDVVFVEDSHIAYQCNCNRQKLATVVKGIGKQEAQSIVDEMGAIEIQCHFCNTKYTFSQQDIESIFNNDNQS